MSVAGVLVSFSSEVGQIIAIFDQRCFTVGLRKFRSGPIALAYPRRVENNPSSSIRNNIAKNGFRDAKKTLFAS